MSINQSSSNNVFLRRNDALRTLKWWKNFLRYDVYILGIDLERLKEKYAYGSTTYQLKANWNKKRFEQAYNYWTEQRKMDKDAGTYTGDYTKDESIKAKQQTLTDYLIYGLIAVLVIFIIWGIIKKKKKK
jgi:hypothetical protein